jgi:hypothetical protein
MSLSPLLIQPGYYLDQLALIEKKLPELLRNASWQTLDIQYHPPRVERIWLKYDALRICLHRIHTAPLSAVLFHQHPWPSAMKILYGAYEMNIGHGPSQSPPPFAATLLLAPNTTYEMITPEGWHSVRPITQISYSLMISGPPWPGRDQKSPLQLESLPEQAKNEILEFFRQQYPLNGAEKILQNSACKHKTGVL